MEVKFLNVRVDESLKAEIEDLARALARKDGRNVTLTEVVLSALEYGLPFVRQDICSEIVLPNDTLPKSKQLVLAAKQIFERGLAGMIPGESA